MLLIIDNYDSFTHNLAQAFGGLGKPIKIFRNDKIDCGTIRKLKPDWIVISPGPCTPKESGISIDVIKNFSGDIPILGVCLGHQCIGEVFGGKVVRADRPVHGKTSLINHDGETIFRGVKNPFEATRYHSLVVERSTLPKCLEVSAECGGIIMGVRHKEFEVEGVQFHPESFLTKEGTKILKNFLTL